MKDKLTKSILENTINNHLKWNKTNSTFSTETSHYYQCKLNDGSTIDVCVLLSDTFLYNYCSYLVIKNENLVDGRLHINSSSDKNIEEIGKEIYKKYIKPVIIPRVKSQDEVISDIFNSIPSKSDSRDSKINEIIKGNEEIIKVIGEVESKFPWAKPTLPTKNITGKKRWWW